MLVLLKLFTVVCTCVYYNPIESGQDNCDLINKSDQNGPSDSLLDPCLVFLQQ